MKIIFCHGSSVCLAVICTCSVATVGFADSSGKLGGTFYKMEKHLGESSELFSNQGQ